jgi:ATP-dependent exoDNAse (exonuclease V) beta subunit
MTRAETYLHIFGEAGTGQKSWHKKVLQSSLLKSLQSSNDEIQKFGFGEYESCDFQKITDTKCHEEEITIPEWYYQKFPDVQNYENIEKQSNATIFGDCVHALLSKVCVYYDDLKIVADSIINSFDLTDEAKQCAIETAMKVYQKLPALFNHSAKSEISFFYDGKEGRIDHVVTLGNDIWIIDWKTGEPGDPIPEEYQNQLRFYQLAYENLLNIKARIAIVWTKNQDLIEIQS